MPEGLPFNLKDYIEWVDIIGRIMREDKRGHIENKMPLILKMLNIEAEQWQNLTHHFENKLKGLVGSVYQLKEACKVLGYKRVYCSSWCKNYFP